MFCSSEKFTNLNVFVMVTVIALVVKGGNADLSSRPVTISRVENMTVAISKQVTLACKVDNIDHFKVSWMRADSQTVLTMDDHVVISDSRIRIERTTSSVWSMTIKSVQETDAGCYICQVNSVPMISSTGCLFVEVPPRFISGGAKGDIIVTSNSNVTLQCTAHGRPLPSVQWLKEDSTKYTPLDMFTIENKDSVSVVLQLERVDRSDAGAYLCIARNRIPPAISQRYVVNVLFGPVVRAANHIVTVRQGGKLRIQCTAEGYPTPQVRWHRPSINNMSSRQVKILQSMSGPYRLTSVLEIVEMDYSDSGKYVCSASSSLGRTSVPLGVHVLPAPPTEQPHPRREILGFNKPSSSYLTSTTETSVTSYINFISTESPNYFTSHSIASVTDQQTEFDKETENSHTNSGVDASFTCKKYRNISVLVLLILFPVIGL